MILFSVTFELMVIVGLFKSSGIIFVATQERFGSSASMTSLISTINSVSWSVTSLLAMNIGSKFLSSRAITVLGILVSFISYIIASVTQDFELLLLSNGILQGVGGPCVEPIALSMLGNYFEKHRGLACSISSSGGLVLAPLLTIMFDFYGFSGTMLLDAAFVFQCLVTAMLFRPQSFFSHGKRKIKKKDIDSDRNTDAGLQMEHNVVAVNDDTPYSSVDLYGGHGRTPSANLHTYVSNVLPAMYNEAVELSSKTDSKERAFTGFHFDKVVKRGDQFIDTDYTNNDCTERHQTSLIDGIIDELSHAGIKSTIGMKRYSCFQRILELFDFSLFKNPVFIVLFLAAGFIRVPCALCMAYLAPHAKDVYLKPSEIAKILYCGNTARRYRFLCRVVPFSRSNGSGCRIALFRFTNG